MKRLEADSSFYVPSSRPKLAWFFSKAIFLVALTLRPPLNSKMYRWLRHGADASLEKVFAKNYVGERLVAVKVRDDDDTESLGCLMNVVSFELS